MSKDKPLLFGKDGKPVPMPNVEFIEGKPTRKWPDLTALREYEPSFEKSEFSKVDGRVPLLLLPVRLETRIDLRKNAETLRIRIYPDQLHVATNDDALTQIELNAGRYFWKQAQRDDRGLQIAALEQLISVVGRPRVGHVAERTHPEYKEPEEDIDNRGNPFVPDDTRRPKLTCLPKRWVAIGYSLDKLSFFQVSNPIAGPLSTAIAGEDAIDPKTPVTKDGLWMVDYHEALERGMAIDVPLRAELLAAGEITSLIVFGVNDDLDVETVSEQFGALMGNHERASGLGFMPQGLPTNNSRGEKTPWTRNDSPVEELLDALLAKDEPASGSALGETRKILGLGDIPALMRAPNATDNDRSLARAMNTVLYDAVIGRFIHTLIPADGEKVDAYELSVFRRWFIRHVTGGAPVATIRVGAQPYGMLPVAALPRGPISVAVPKDTRGFIERTVLQLRTEWLRALDTVPLLDPNAIDRKSALDRPASSIPALLASQPHPARLFLRTVYRDQDDLVRRYEAAIAYIENNDTRLFNMVQSRTVVLPFARDIDEQLALWASVHANIASSGNSTNWKNRAHNRINQILMHLGRIEQRQRPLKSIKPPLFSGVVGKPMSAYLEAKPAATSAELDDFPLVTTEEGTDGKSLATETLHKIADGIDDDKIPKISPPDLLTALVLSGLENAKGQERAEIENALRALANIDDPTRLERLARETLGLGSHRLDAWYSSLASAQIDFMRTDGEAKSGLGLGAFGWVTDLQFDKKPRSNGFIHAPSPAQAATSAILRSGWLAHGGEENRGPGAVNADSARIRLAHTILGGVRNGQSLGTLLGYRFERRLREHPSELGGWIRDIRTFVIAQTGSDATPDEPVDGERLLDLYSKGALDGGPFLAVADLKDEVVNLLDIFDAVHDVSLLEGTHAAATGRSEHASAVFEAVNQGTRLPPKYNAHQNPRSGATVDHRAMLVFSAERPDANDKRGWVTGLRDQIMPGLEGWLRSFLPSATDIGMTVNGEPVALNKLQLSACDTLYLMGEDPTKVSPAIKQLAAKAAGKAGKRAETLTVLADTDKYPVSLEELQLIATEIRAALDTASPLDANSFGGRGAVGPASTEDMKFEDTIQDVLATLQNAIAQEDLDALARFGLASGAPDQRLERAARILDRSHNERLAPADHAALLFGRALPLVPVFRIPSGGITFHDDFSKPDPWLWLDKIGSVRPPIGRLTTARMLAKLTGAAAMPLHAGQDRRERNEFWAAISKPPAGTGSRVSVVACGSDAPPQVGSLVSGLMIDQWSERIPEPDQVTGVAFQFDAPSTKPPQAMLLATAPRTTEKWTMRDVAAVLFDTLQFSALRMVQPENLTDFGSVLPTIYADLDPGLHTQKDKS